MRSKQKKPRNGAFFYVVKGPQNLSNHFEAEKVLDVMADWSFSLNNLSRDQASMRQRIF